MFFTSLVRSGTVTHTRLNTSSYLDHLQLFNVQRERQRRLLTCFIQSKGRGWRGATRSDEEPEISEHLHLRRTSCRKRIEDKKKQWWQQITIFSVHKQQSSIIKLLNIHFPGCSVSKLKQLTSSSVGLIDICQKRKRFTWRSSWRFLHRGSVHAQRANLQPSISSVVTFTLKSQKLRGESRCWTKAERRDLDVC